MDASQYEDYALVLLFIKQSSGEYAGQPFAPIQILRYMGFVKEQIAAPPINRSRARSSRWTITRH